MVCLRRILGCGGRPLKLVADDICADPAPEIEMQLLLGRIVLAALAMEALGIMVLILLVALFGPADASAAQRFAEQLGDWVGPLSGAAFCLLGGYWVASGTRTHRVLNGLLLGSLAAAIDVGALIALGTPWRLLFVISNVGRILFGTLGGWWVSKRRPQADIV